MKKISFLLFIVVLLFSCGEKKKSNNELRTEARAKLDAIINNYCNSIIKQEKINLLFDTLKSEKNFTIFYQNIFKKPHKVLISNENFNIDDIIDADTCYYINLNKNFYERNSIRLKLKNKDLVDRFHKYTVSNSYTNIYFVAEIKKVSKCFLKIDSEVDTGIELSRSDFRFFEADLDTIYFANLNKQVIFPERE